jgi:ribonuclease J
VTVVAIVDIDTGALAEPPDFITRGFPDNSEGTFAPVVPLIASALAQARGRNISDTAALERMIGEVVEIWAKRHLRRFPIVVPVVIEG